MIIWRQIPSQWTRWLPERIKWWLAKKRMSEMSDLELRWMEVKIWEEIRRKNSPQE